MQTVEKSLRDTLQDLYDNLSAQELIDFAYELVEDTPNEYIYQLKERLQEILDEQ